MTIEEQLRDTMRGWLAPGVALPGSQAPLITAGVLDSMGVINLLMWIEERTGRPVDTAAVDLVAELDTIESIVRFVERGHPGVTTRPAKRPDGLVLESYEPRHRKAIGELMRRLWSPDPALNESFFEWRYGEGQSGGEPLIYLYTHEGQPVAMRALHATLWEAGAHDPPVPVYVADDLAVAREFEGHGLFGAFTEAIRADLAARGHAYFLSPSALRVTRKLSLRAGAIPVDPFHPLGVRSARAQWLDGLRDVAGKLPLLWRHAAKTMDFERAGHFFQRLDAAASGEILVERTARAEDMAALVASLPRDGRIRQRRDRRYFEWRYRNPLHEYRFAYACRGGQLCGYLIVERSLSSFANPRRAHIVEWEADSPQVRESLLRGVLQAGRPAELVIWEESAEASAAAVLRDHGFRAIDKLQSSHGIPGMLVWPVALPADPELLRIGGRSLLEQANWDIRIADTSYG